MSGNRVRLSDVITEAQPGFACGEDPADGVFQFRMNNVTTDGTIDLSKKRRVPSTTRSLGKFVLEPGDVLFNATNSPELVGKTAYFPGLDEPAVFSNHFVRLKPNVSEIDGRYLARWLALQFQRGVFTGMCRQWVNQASVGRDALLALEIPLPTLPQQRRIAAILDQADALRAKRRAAIALLDTLAQSIFLDMFGDPVANTKAWQMRRLSNVADLENGDRSSNYPSGEEIKEHGVLFLSTRNIRDGALDLTNAVYISEDKFASLSRGKARRGDLVITLRGTLGSCCIFESEHERAFINAQMLIIRPECGITSTFLHALLTSQPSKARFARMGTGVAVPQLTSAQLGAMDIPVPPLDLQREFDRRADRVNRLRSAYDRSLAHLDELFASLQHRAFRGEL